MKPSARRPTRASRWCDQYPPRREPWKKALLIGIRYPLEDLASMTRLNGPHNDVAAMRQALIDLYSYPPESIKCLIDDGVDEEMQPTRANILSYTREMVRGALPGDRFFFHYAGHGVQVVNRTNTEEDGFDECIIPCDGERYLIQDNELRCCLVDPLPIGSQLIAIFDSCHSASLLDLKHYRCNRVYVPWVSKGARRTMSMWSNVVRQQELWTERPPPPAAVRANSGPSSHQLLRGHSTHSISEQDQRTRRWSFGSPTDLLVNPSEGNWYGDDRLHISRRASPEPIWPCDGWCKPEPEEGAHVVSISAAKDYQLAWEDPTGSSLTMALVESLRINPHPRFTDLLRDISHSLHRFYLDLHPESRHFRMRIQAINRRRLELGWPLIELDPLPEMTNFQTPQVSAHVPLVRLRLHLREKDPETYRRLATQYNLLSMTVVLSTQCNDCP